MLIIDYLRIYPLVKLSVMQLENSASTSQTKGQMPLHLCRQYLVLAVFLKSFAALQIEL